MCDRERECVCDRERVCVCVCDRERERERESKRQRRIQIEQADRHRHADRERKTDNWTSLQTHAGRHTDSEKRISREMDSLLLSNTTVGHCVKGMAKLKKRR